MQDHDSSWKEFACDGDAILNMNCKVPLSQIKTDFSLESLAEIKVKIIATNQYGDSPSSEVGKGAKIVIAPDAPNNVATDFDATSST